MALTPGTRLGTYEILSTLGAGGMGEVYHARDVRLERSVAIKALPDALSADPGRLSRFEREAKLLASLNHPGIASIYGLEEVAGAIYLVLEFIEGETLASRLSRGALSPRETLEIGGHIAAAIEAAHERGVVHRDLKPANVMLTRSGTVKVLDFGLARGDGQSAESSSNLSASPTMAIGVTGDGIILGTAPYMSPEQARGRGVDRRADVWSFGCILFECLTGRQAFEGETVSDVIARILEREHDWAALTPATPARLTEVVRRCLTKNATERPRDVGDIRLELSSILQQLSSPSGLRAAAPREVPSLAVLYFDNLANDKESEYFCAGITEDILTDLSKVKGLRVASKNAVMRYRGTQADLAKVGSELGVRTVLEGSVRRSGDRVRITAQLINAADGFQLWAERYDRTLEDVFAVQEEIASAITGALRVALTPEEAENLVQNRPSNAKAYDLYLKGRALYGRYDNASLRTANELFEKAIEIDPDYALAWAGIADCMGQLTQYEFATNPEEILRRGFEAAKRAIALNPGLAEGHKALGLVLRQMGDLDGARASILKAIEINPRFIPAIINLAVSEFGRADIASVERLIRRAIDIDPQEAFAASWLCVLLHYTNRPEECFRTIDRLEQIAANPFYVLAVWLHRAWLHLDLGDYDAAQQAAEKGMEMGADPANLRIIAGSIAARTGHVEEARKVLDASGNLAGVSAPAVILLAGMTIRLGDIERSRQFLVGKGMSDLMHTWCRLDPELHPILDQKPFAPRRRDATLVWPLEAPMIDPARFALFREVRIESGRPSGSGLTPA